MRYNFFWPGIFLFFVFNKILVIYTLCSVMCVILILQFAEDLLINDFISSFEKDIGHEMNTFQYT